MFHVDLAVFLMNYKSLAVVCGRQTPMYSLCEWEEGLLPFFLLDGRGYRFDNPLLDSITQTPHIWDVVIGMPYGTALW